MVRHPAPLLLTEEQRRIVEAPPGHYVITAVAGSGKTTTLAHRIHHLLQQGSDPRRMLVLMFNREARNDFVTRMGKVIPAGRPTPEVRTFHAMGYRLYQRFIEKGLLAPFQGKVLSEKEVQFQILRCQAEVLNAKSNAKNDAKKLRELRGQQKEHVEVCSAFIEEVKSSLLEPEIVFDESGLDSEFDYVIDVFERFEAWRRQQRRISFADMLYDTVRAIRKHPALHELVSNKMDVVLVDEYQDTSSIQHELLKVIAGTRAKITIVGDPDQTIYEFRGAKPEYMLSGFAREYPSATPLQLSYSFRYGHTLALLASHLIQQNRQRTDVLCKAAPGNPQTRVELHQSTQETRLLIDLLRAQSPEQLARSAILIRVWSQATRLELELLKHKIPYRMPDHASVFDSSEYRGIKALLSLAHGELAQAAPAVRSDAFRHLMLFPHCGLPDPVVQHLSQTLGHLEQDWGKHLDTLIPSDLKKIQQLKLERLARALVKAERGKVRPAMLLQRYEEDTDLFEGLRGLSMTHEQGEEKVAIVQSIMAFVASLSSEIETCLSHLAELESAAKIQPPQALTLCTIHRAKGLEWDHVYLPGLDDQHYPNAQHGKALDKAELESERRLLYVAMTRARLSLHLFTPPKTDAPSRFIAEMDIPTSLAIGQWIEQPHQNEPEWTQVKKSVLAMAYIEQIRPEATASSLHQQQPLKLA